MKLPDGRQMEPDPGILAEPVQEADRIVLWRAGTCDASWQKWERIASVARAPVEVVQGICSVPATALESRQPIRGFFGSLWQRFRLPTDQPAWLLPNGQSVEQCGERRTDVLLVWSADAAQPLDESQIRNRWPQSQRIQPLGRNLFMVIGVAPPTAEQTQIAPEGPPHEQAEQRLAAARQAGDRRQEALALADLGIARLHKCDAAQAVQFLEDAWTVIRSLDNRSWEGDVIGNLGLARLKLGQPEQALPLFEQELAIARQSHNHFAAKLALAHLGQFHADTHNPRSALAFYEQALTLARTLADRQDEIKLLWQLAIQTALLGRLDKTLTYAQATVDLAQKVNHPEAAWYADHVQKYRQANGARSPSATGKPAATGSTASLAGSPIIASAMHAPPSGSAPPQPAGRGSGILGMAFSAVKATGKFVGSGFQTVADSAYQKRLQSCTTCEHHTGLRCRLCGCFTGAKAKLPHEDCPLGKWPR